LRLGGGAAAFAEGDDLYDAHMIALGECQHIARFYRAARLGAALAVDAQVAVTDKA